MHRVSWCVMASDNFAERYCIVGAGSSGLTVAKNLAAVGIPFDCFEKLDNVGGNWYYGKPGSSVYQSTHLISSKKRTEFTDFPIPDEFPEFLSHQQAWQYLSSYAHHFGLYDRIQFNQSVIKIDRCEHGWQVLLQSGESRIYRGVIIANGHNWDPKWPKYPGIFGGQVLHSAHYKTPDVLAGKRVLVVGAGNSGCDIAVESAQHAAVTMHSVRRGYYYLPKFLYGKPADQCGEKLLRWRLPLWLRRLITYRVVKAALGRPEDYGLPAPDHRFLESHPIINSQMLYYVGHGKIQPRPDIAELLANGVKFTDGRIEEFDVIVYATGFNISFPFIDNQYLNWHDGRPHLYLNIFHPTEDGLFTAGLIQPDSGQWGLVDYQAQLIAQVILAQHEAHPLADRFRRLKNQDRRDLGAGIRYIDSTRHLLEVEHYSYRRRLQKMIREYTVRAPTATTKN